MPNYLFNAAVCWYNSIDPDDIKIGVKESTECLCLTSDCCLALKTNPYDVGMVTQSDEICKVGAYCCTLGLKKPKVLCSGAGHCLCFKEVASLPFDSAFVGEPLCAICFVKLYPTNDFGLAKTAPTCSAMSR
mmetsp:Transcript_7551/g.7139  ORF Transcript_7551/g.7139 Transcript_7551/m.7139 type:complete len:132 (+) Transcript_7551:71-466(+)